VRIISAAGCRCSDTHDAGDAGRIVAVTLIDLHLEYRSGMARVDTDHRQAKLFELAPQQCGRRSCLKADPYRSRCLRSHECSDRLRIGIDYALLARLIPPGSPHRSMSSSTTRLAQYSPPLSLSIFARPHRMASCLPGELIPCASCGTIPELPHVASILTIPARNIDSKSSTNRQH